MRIERKKTQGLFLSWKQKEKKKCDNLDIWFRRPLMVDFFLPTNIFRHKTYVYFSGRIYFDINCFSII